MFNFFMDSFPGTPIINIDPSRNASQELNFAEFNIIMSSPLTNNNNFSPERNSRPQQQLLERENRFISSATMNLIRNNGLDSPIASGNQSDNQNDGNIFDDDFLNFNDAQSGMNSPMFPKKKQEFESSHTQLEEDMLPYPDTNYHQSIQFDDNLSRVAYIPQAAAFDSEEEFTGKKAPIGEDVSAESPKKSQKVQRKKIQKSPKVKIEKLPKKAAQSQSVAVDGNKTTKKRESKNIVKNYGKAMAAFSISPAAEPYLKDMLLKNKVTLEEFKTFIINSKESIDGIGTLRNLLYADIFEETQMLKLKSVFRGISEVFIRDFCINWIFNCRSQYKKTLLDYRFNMLRRVQDPSNFTHLKTQ